MASRQSTPNLRTSRMSIALSARFETPQQLGTFPPVPASEKALGTPPLPARTRHVIGPPAQIAPCESAEARGAGVHPRPVTNSRFSPVDAGVVATAAAVDP